MSAPGHDTPVVRAVHGSVTHANGHTTYGLHIRNAAGDLELVAGQMGDTIDWERWWWAYGEALRLLSTPPVR